MIVSLAELVVLSLVVDWLFRRLAIPGLVGMLLLGVAFGPYVLGLIDPRLLTASADFRLIALIVILLRAEPAAQEIVVCPYSYKISRLDC